LYYAHSLILYVVAYTCTISNSGGSDTYTAFLTVYTQPVFVVTPYPKVVRHQSTVRFRCATVGNPDPVLSWSKNQVSLYT